jgi:predicted PurR-regulated permease PerM
VIIVVYTIAAAWLVLGLVFREPFAPLLSLAVGALEPIPVIGPAIAMALIGGSALINGDGGWTLLAAVLFAVLLRLSIDLVVGPLVLGHAVDLHPLVILFAFLVGASLFGILGVLLAVPVAAAIKIVLRVLYEEPPSVPEPPMARPAGAE